MFDRRQFILAGAGALFLGLIVGTLFLGGITGNVIGEWVSFDYSNSSYVEYEDSEFLMSLYKFEWVEFPFGRIMFQGAGDPNEEGFDKFVVLFNESQELNDNATFFSTTYILENQTYYFQSGFSDNKTNIVGVRILNYSVDSIGERIFLDVFLRDREAENGWTQWFNFRKPDSEGDVSNLIDMDSIFGTQTCDKGYTHTQCRVVDGVSSEESGQNVYCGWFNVMCRNDLNSEPCYDYEIRFNCLPKPINGSFCNANFCEFVEGKEERLLRTNLSVKFENIESKTAEVYVSGYSPVIVSPGNNYTFGDLTLVMVPSGYNLNYWEDYAGESDFDSIIFWYSYNDPSAIRESFCENNKCTLYEGETIIIGDTGHFVKVDFIDVLNSNKVNLTFDGNDSFESGIFNRFDYDDLEIYINHVNVDHYGDRDKDYLIFSYISNYDTGYWTPWFDSDTPNETSGDSERRWDLYYSNPEEMCERPSRIECQTLNGTDWSDTGDYVVCSVGGGLSCYNEEGNMCEDYRVRFYCVPPLSDGSFCEDGTCYIFEDDNVTIVENGQVYVVHAGNIVQGSYPYATLNFNSIFDSDVGISESLTYKTFNLKVSDIMYPYSQDTKDLVIFDYVVLDLPVSGGGSSGGGSSGSADEEDVPFSSGCDGNVCTIYNADTLSVEGHDIYSLMLLPNRQVYLELDGYLEKFVVKNSVFNYENLTIQILDYRMQGDSMDYVRFTYLLEDKNYVKHCQGPVCIIDENSRLSLGDSKKIVAAGEIKTYVYDADVDFYHNGNKHDMDGIFLDINMTEGYSFVYGGLLIKPLHVKKGTGEDGKDQYVFIFEDLSGEVPQGDFSVCSNDICKIFVGDMVLACGHTFELNGIRVLDYGELSVVRVDQSRLFEIVDNMGTSYENISFSVLGHYSRGNEIGLDVNRESYVEIKCSVIENKSYVKFCYLGEECVSYGNDRIGLGDDSRVVSFDRFSIYRSSDHDILRTKVYYYGEEYVFEVDSRYLDFAFLEMGDLKLQVLGLDEYSPYEGATELSLRFNFVIDEDYVWGEGEGPNRIISAEKPIDYDSVVPTSSKVSQEECAGCYDGINCYDVSYRMRDKYCSVSLEILSQKSEGDYCEYNFECYSNNCLDGVCSYKNFVQRLFRWFSWVFT